MDGGEVNAFDIDGVDLVKLCLRHLQCGAVAMRPAGIVDHAIQALAVGLCKVHHVRPIRTAGDVSRTRPCLATAGFDLLANTIGTQGVDVVDGHHSPFFGQALGNALTNAVACTGDQNGLTFDSHMQPFL